MTPPEAARGGLAILTVTRNDRTGLMATRGTLRAQTEQDFTWVVVDGASTDGTAEWLRDHGDEMGWWRSAPDTGPFDAMNHALDAARTLGCEHALFLNAGDRLAGPDSAALLRDAVRLHPDATLLYGDALERLGDERILLKPSRSHRWAALGMFTHHQAMLYRIAALTGLRFDDRYAIAADYAFTLAAMGRGAAVHLPFAICVFAPNGLSQRNPAQGRREQSLIRRELLGHGPLRETLLQTAQRSATALRRHFPAAYAKWRFRRAETLFLS
ncbi:glycosyltransferase [Azospirillum doebereinerae]|uniref:Glycosyltransferase n=1 Tax=Azospirillum doebereinerae TaxID=92933 RepID=A0A3S0WK23_9PROT|nr:glycosyltransferase [Azospirillum doebereinerae]MCG5239801.1 glycosyltransferase [Azospirillum doebereinerae]RUQ67188.1 glycosyltransferase [Azospirillum doebereinerae]